MKWYLVAVSALFFGGLSFPMRSFAQNPSNSSSQKNSENKSVQGTWNIRMGQLQEKDPYNQRNITDFRLGLNLYHSLIEYTFINFAPTFKFRSGYQQTQADSEPQQNELGVREASFNVGNTKEDSKDFGFLLSTGAIDQTNHTTRLLFYEQTFAAAKLNIHSSGFFGEAEYAIPTSSSLSTQTKDFEKTPQYTSLILGFETNSNAFSGTYSLGTFAFENIPGKTATSSSLRGNTTRPTSGRDSEFKFEYAGYFLATKSEFAVFKNNYLGLRADYLANDRVDSNLGQAFDVRGHWKLIWNKTYTFTPFYQFFRVDSDATIAAYNWSLYNTNRQGYRSGLEVQFKQKLSVSASFGEKDAIIESPFIQRDNFFMLTLETSDVEI